MSKDRYVISGNRGRRLQRKAPRAGAKQKSFTKERRQTFLDHFAASCNQTAAARAAGVSRNCIDRWVKKNPAFAAAWREALNLGVAALEAELIRAAREAVKIRPNKAAAVRIGTMDAKTSLAVLEAYRRSRDRAPGECHAQPYDVAGVKRRLEAKMKALGLLGRGCPNCGDVEVFKGEVGPSTGSAGSVSGPDRLGDGPLPGVPLQKQGRKGPSTASRSPSPGNPGEENLCPPE